MRILHHTRTYINQDGGESLHTVFGESGLVPIRIEDVYHGLASIRKSNGRGRLKFLKFGGRRLAVSAPIRLTDHNRLILTLKAVALL